MQVSTEYLTTPYSHTTRFYLLGFGEFATIEEHIPQLVPKKSGDCLIFLVTESKLHKCALIDDWDWEKLQDTEMCKIFYSPFQLLQESWTDDHFR